MEIGPRARAALIDDRLVLLDIAAGDYLVLTATETAMWRALTELSAERRVGALAGQFEAPAALIAADLAQFEKMCLARGYLVARPLPPGGPPRAGDRDSLSALRAWLWMFRVSGALRRSFQEAYDKCQRLRRPREPRPPGLLQEAESAFLRAENFFIFRKAPKDCLPRSLSLYAFLTSAGFDVTHVIGVSRFPFEAHAWVEGDGRVLLDRPDWVRTYAPLARI